MKYYTYFLIFLFTIVSVSAQCDVNCLENASRCYRECPKDVLQNIRCNNICAKVARSCTDECAGGI